MDDVKIAEIAYRVVPVDRGYDLERALAACKLIGELVGRLTYVTQVRAAIPQAPHAYRLIGALAEATDRVPLLIQQLAVAIDMIGDDDPTLFDDRPGVQATETVYLACSRLNSAMADARHAVDALVRAKEHLGHLGHDRP